MFFQFQVLISKYLSMFNCILSNDSLYKRLMKQFSLFKYWKYVYYRCHCFTVSNSISRQYFRENANYFSSNSTVRYKVYLPVSNVDINSHLFTAIVFRLNYRFPSLLRSKNYPQLIGKYRHHHIEQEFAASQYTKFGHY